MSTDDSPPEQGGTTDATANNQHNRTLQRGSFTDLTLGEDAPEHLADLLATLGSMRFEYKQATIDDPSTRFVVEYAPTDECPAHLEDRIGEDYYELDAQELPDGRLAVRFGTFLNRDDDLWVIGDEERLDTKVKRAAQMDNTQQKVTTYRTRGHGDLTIHNYNRFAAIIFEAAQARGFDIVVQDVSTDDPYETVEIRGYQYAFYEKEEGLYMPLGHLEDYGTAGITFDPNSLDDEFTDTIEGAASRASFYEESIRLEVAETNADRPIAEKQAEGTVETLERGSELEKPWIETGHRRVYYASEDDQNPEFKSTDKVTHIGVEIAEAFPEWDVVITTGFREYAISYNIRYDLGAIHLDVDNLMPAHQHVGGTARDIHKGLNEGDA